MRVLKASEMARIENLAYQDGISDEIYMQNAGLGIAKILINLIEKKKLSPKINIIAGKGNNAGDGYVVASLLLEKGYTVKVFQLFEINTASSLCKLNHDRFDNKKGNIIYVKNISDLVFDEKCFILDGIFGTGFQGEIKGFLLDVIKKINSSNLKIVSIDIPSGLNGNSGKTNSIAIKADVTIYLGCAKLGFFINDGPDYIGNLEYVDFGLLEKYKKLANFKLEYMDKFNFKDYLPKIDRKRHKYEAGFVMGIAGSKGMFGAAKLAALAVYRSGSGIVKMITQVEIPNPFYELVNFVIDYEKTDEIIEYANKADSIFIGPGLGRDQKIEDFLFKIFPKITKKTILDADALYHLANNSMILPKLSVLTPHKNEMKRLLKAEKIEDDALIEKTKKFSQDKNVIIVLKGYPTTVFHPKKEPVTILGGDPGLATAGTGDVLTGMIASFAAQKLDLYDASLLAVNLHFLAAELAAKKKTSYSLIASDVIDFLPEAFKEVL
ncbi:MAG: Bifunctional NAD(P)H-hydrate repair enzyme Nnr [Candidatus Anoxychlamydiales bacterium]|nr:Bifunctional NAD(P)H-hydrate repair enzyme Nnr [Candidatus Anoxychlamydiales bacterium]NGX36049.1 Bifunctional NAD(P)H-hydrate repair enzyme Nnr [Candidatus Anoxychlamydiales bacterium]